MNGDIKREREGEVKQGDCWEVGAVWWVTPKLLPSHDVLEHWLTVSDGNHHQHTHKHTHAEASTNTDTYVKSTTPTRTQSVF